MHFDGVVFAGGGCRCFWQAGFWSSAADELQLAPKAISAVSAGVAFACAATGGIVDVVLRDFVRRTAANPRNFYPRNSVGPRPIFPHGQMYREAIMSTMDSTTLERIGRGPQVRALLALPPLHVPLHSALLLAFAAYELDRTLRRSVHPRFGRRLGFRPRVVTASASETPEALAETILQSSCMPPITPQYRRDGEPVIDGGIIDNAPVDLLGDCESKLVLLSRRYDRLPHAPGVRYVQPSVPVPVALWDYASPSLIQQTFDLGRRDGELFCARAARLH